MSWKLASTVRRGTFGKVPLDGNSLGVYPTIKVWWFRQVRTAAQGAGGPHILGVSHILAYTETYDNITSIYTRTRKWTLEA